MALKPYIDDDLYADEPDNQDIDTGPLTRVQLQGLARDQIAALRNTAMELWQDHRIGCDVHLIDRLEFQLCEK